MKDNRTYKNLIDICISFSENPDLSGDMPELFRSIIAEYFFTEESAEKNMLNVFKKLETPELLDKLDSIFNIDLEQLEIFIKGDTINNSLSGKIYLSNSYLKIFYSNYPPEFKQIPKDIQDEIITKIKNKNKVLIEAFQKMQQDIEATRQRTIAKLIALSLKNVHKKYALIFTNNHLIVKDVIQEIFNDSDDIFKAKQNQISEINDDSKIKELIKKFFKVKQFQEIQDITDKLKSEFQRYEKRSKFFIEEDS